MRGNSRSFRVGAAMVASACLPHPCRGTWVEFVQHEVGDDGSSVYLCAADDKVYSTNMSHLEVAAAIQQYKTDRIMRKRWQEATDNLWTPEDGGGFRPQVVSVESATELSGSWRVTIVNASEWARYLKNPPRARDVRFIPQLLVPTFEWESHEVVYCFSYDSRLPLRHHDPETPLAERPH